MSLRWRAYAERLRGSLFFVPMLAVLGAVVLAFGALALDSRVDGSEDLPIGLGSTVDSARTLLSTVAAATITFAAIAFSVSVLVIQQAASQYSPRVVHTLSRDPFNKRVMGLVMGTFTYCLVVLRSVHDGLDEGADPLIPNFSVALALVLGVATILAVIAFIDHSAHAMDISEILDRARREASEHVRDMWSLDRVVQATDDGADAVHRIVRFDRSGWVQQIDDESLLGCLPGGATMRVATWPGHYAVQGGVLCTLSPPDANPTDVDIRRAITIGKTRTMLQDPSYGVRELVDVALRALSPGVNDPTTAQDAIFHVAALVVELLRRDPPPRVRRGDGGSRLVLTEQHTPRGLVDLAFDEVRRAAAPHPAVCIYLLEALRMTADAIEEERPHRVHLLREQAALVLEGCEAAGALPADAAAVRAAHDRRFAVSV